MTDRSTTRMSSINISGGRIHIGALSVGGPRPARNYFRCNGCGTQQDAPVENGASLVVDNECPECGRSGILMSIAATEPPTWWRP